MSTLEKYVKNNHPAIVEEYSRYSQKDQLPKVGDKVISLRRGFGGLAGVVLEVTEIDKGGITLTNGENNYFSALESWYKDLKRY